MGDLKRLFMNTLVGNSSFRSSQKLYYQNVRKEIIRVNLAYYLMLNPFLLGKKLQKT